MSLREVVDLQRQLDKVDLATESTGVGGDGSFKAEAESLKAELGEVLFETPSWRAIRPPSLAEYAVSSSPPEKSFSRLREARERLRFGIFGVRSVCYVEAGPRRFRANFEARSRHAVADVRVGGCGAAAAL